MRRNDKDLSRSCPNNLHRAVSIECRSIATRSLLPPRLLSAFTVQRFAPVPHWRSEWLEPIDLSSNGSEAILPGPNGNVFQDSRPLFGTEPDPRQTSELLHISSVGVNPSSHSNVSGAFASSLAESDGNGGVGVSQLIFGLPNPDGTDQNVVRQLVAQSLWTQTFLYAGSPTVDLTLHLRIPSLQVELFGIPPNRDNPSFTETAEASARVDTVITHADGTFSKGGSFELGLREFETQLPSGNPALGLENFADLDL